MANSRLCSIPNCGKSLHCKGFCRGHYERLLKHGDPLGGEKSPRELRRFIQEVVLPYDGSDCLAWPYGKDSKGYGAIWIDGRTLVAPRYVCELVHGAPPTPEHECAHSCGKGHEGCISPEHLSWKTVVENKADRLIHGTHVRGERNIKVKLTEDQVREIRRLKGVRTQGDLALEYGVGQTAISKIHCGISWSWLP
ncbi:hypothetical protein ACVJBD_002349 [Rhizobium mongolense]